VDTDAVQPAHVQSGAAAAAAAACTYLTALKGWYWDIPGPIFLNYIATYNVSQDTLQVTPPPATPAFFLIFLYRQLFVNYGAIFFLLFSLPIAFLLDRPNCFRPAVLISAVCNLTGCVLRLLARSTSLDSIILLHASYAINAIGAPGPLLNSHHKTPI
jgi:hypothetical protein